MNRPFVFGKKTPDANFIGREEESERLRKNFKFGVNTILVSPRRWGKTSIVHRIGNEVKSDKLIVVYMDIFSCRSEYDFYNTFAEQILIQTGNRFEEWKSIAADFIARLSHRVSLGITPKTHKPEEVLNLPQTIAEKKGCDILVCIDEFQQVGEFADSLSVQKRMRGVWQLQQNVSYCLYGSKKHMMESLFLKKSFPFYKFGDTVPLNKIPLEKWIPYIKRGFETSGKGIGEKVIEKLCESVDYNPSYVQQFAWILLTNTTTDVTDSDVDASLQELIDENAPLFTQQTESLTTYQLNFLRAIMQGVQKDFGKAEIREEYNLGSYPNIVRIKSSLIDKELIDVIDGLTYIADPLLKLWLKRILNQ